MAAPKKYKTNTLKNSSSKKSSSRATSKKRPASRVGSTKLAKKNFFKSWMALPIIAVVALAGYMAVQFSNASNGTTLQAQSSTCRSTTKNNGQNAAQCLRNQSIKYKTASLNSGKYKVCFSISASNGTQWQLGARRELAYTPMAYSTYSERSASSEQYGVAARTPCTSTVTINGKDRIVAELVTTNNGTNSGAAQYYGVYVYGAKLVSVGNSTSSADTNAASRRQEEVRNCTNKADISSERSIGHGTQLVLRGFRWVNGSGCKPYFKRVISVRCSPGYTARGNSCTPTPRPVVVRCDNSNETKRGNTCVNKYGYQNGFNCPAGYSKMTAPYANRNKYRCQKRVNSREFSFSKPTPLSCFSDYRVANTSDKWQICIRKSNR